MLGWSNAEAAWASWRDFRRASTRISRSAHPFGYSSRRPPAPAHQGDAPVKWNRPSGSLRARSATFRISGDMSPDVNAPVMGPFESSHQHGPPLLGRVREPTRSPTSSLVCSPPTPSLRLPPSRRPRLRSSLAGGLPCPSCDKEEEGPPRCLGRPLLACRRLRPRWVRVSACPSRRDRQRLQAAQDPGHPE